MVEVFGSGPLKTFLPGADIDITVVYIDKLLKNSNPGVKVEDAMKWPPSDSKREVTQKELEILKEKLEEEGHKDVTVINADVKLIKVKYNGIPIDISFNQVGGICTLALMEGVSQKLGKEQLFKKSIIIIKAWAVYVGRILGSHLGCMSTYSLQVLILYVINEHYDQVKTPLDVFFKFFETYG